MPIDEKRLTELKNDPSQVKQGKHGCCGPAGALMGLLLHGKSEIDPLLKCVYEGAPYRGVAKSEEVAKRITKRLELGLIKKGARNALDLQLCIGLMILVKLHLKEGKNEALWKECDTYSSLFDKWEHGPKLSSATPVKEDPPFSYKHGDLAMTLAVIKALLELVGFTGIESKDLISNVDLMKHEDPEATVPKDKALATKVKEVAKAVTSGSYLGALIGVADQDLMGVPAKAKEAEKYNYVTHWVYLPKQTPSVPEDFLDTTVWTWGKPHTLQDLLERDDHMIPRVAVGFKGWKAKG